MTITVTRGMLITATGLVFVVVVFIGDRREVISTVRIQATGAHGTHIPWKITFNFPSLGHQICLL